MLAATPIGNVGDASQRLRLALGSVDVIACEDTRKARHLLAQLQIEPSGQLISYFEGNELGRVPQILQFLSEGKTVLVISDAGMPSVSDPGYRIAHAAAEAGYSFSVLPGPSAVTTALALSGLPSDRFSFEGFLPRKSGERLRFLEELKSDRRTMIFFESTHRIAETTKDLAAVFGEDRRAVLCRELTKTYEEVIRGTLGELAERCTQEVLGEITLVVQGASEVAETSDADIVVALERCLAAGFDSKSAVQHVVSELNVHKRRVFDLAVALKQSKKSSTPSL